MRAATPPPNRTQEDREPADAPCPVDRLGTGQRGLALGHPRMVDALDNVDGVECAAPLVGSFPANALEFHQGLSPARVGAGEPVAASLACARSLCGIKPLEGVRFIPRLPWRFAFGRGKR